MKRNRTAVIGAGPSGLATARRLLGRGFDVRVFESHDEVGGIWAPGRRDGPVYASARLISSKRSTEFRDFPMPAAWPDYPSREQAGDYLGAYATRFGLRPHVAFRRSVVRAAPTDDGWTLTLDGGESAHFDRLVLAHGFAWSPRLPDIPGRFDGIALHAGRYRTPDLFADLSVLVVGGGNSGFDIAEEASRHARRTFLSLRRGYHVVPKHVFGVPADRFGEVAVRLGVPLRIRRALNEVVLRAIVGRPERYGLPRPDHRLLESHPVVNSRVLGALRDRTLRVVPDVAELDGGRVLFGDGRAEEIDVIVWATGYRLAFPFLDAVELGLAEDDPRLALHVFPVDRPDLAVCGMIQPDSGVWYLADEQARLIASYFAATRDDPEKAARFRERLRGPLPDITGGLAYVASERHRTEVEHVAYERALARFVRLLD